MLIFGRFVHFLLLAPGRMLYYKKSKVPAVERRKTT